MNFNFGFNKKVNNKKDRRSGTDRRKKSSDSSYNGEERRKLKDRRRTSDSRHTVEDRRYTGEERRHNRDRRRTSHSSYSGEERRHTRDRRKERAEIEVPYTGEERRKGADRRKSSGKNYTGEERRKSVDRRKQEPVAKKSAFGFKKSSVSAKKSGSKTSSEKMREAADREKKYGKIGGKIVNYFANLPRTKIWKVFGIVPIDMGPNRTSFFLVKGTYFDYQLLFYMLALIGFGFLMVYSTSYHLALAADAPAYQYMKSQMVAFAIGAVMMFLASIIRYQKYQYFTMLGLAVSVGLMVALFVMGTSKNGSSRWIYIGSHSIQPSEIVKVALILYMAHMFTNESKMLTKYFSAILLLLIPAGFVLVIAKENLSSAMICFGIVIVMWFVATPKPWHVILTGLAGAGVLVGSIFLLGGDIAYRSDRIDAWLHPETAKKGYQVMQSLYAVGSGGLFGRGLGQSIQKTGVPMAYNDMIFSIVCEELGIIGAVAVLALFGLIIWRMKFIIEASADRFGGLLVTGILAHIALQLIVNVGVVTNVLPNTGVTLPFVSYGGTSLMFLMLEMGMVLSVSKQIVPYNAIEQKQGLRLSGAKA